MSALLEVRGLAVSFGAARVVDGVDLEVGAGEVVGLVGESGSGKSVTLRALLRLLHGARVEGRVMWRGQDVLAMDDAGLRALRGAKMAAVFQEPTAALNPVLPIGLQIDESLAAHTQLGAAARRRRAVELLGEVGIADAARRLAAYPHELSGGQRQRAMIAIALASGPELLLADEPTTALDVTIQDQILSLLLRLVADRGMGLLLVTHDLGVVAETCDRMVVLYAGHVAETGGVADVLRRPRHAYTEALLRSMPGEGQARTRLDPIPGQPPRLGRPEDACAFVPRCGHASPACSIHRPPLVEVEPARLSACTAWDRLAQTAFA